MRLDFTGINNRAKMTIVELCGTDFEVYWTEEMDLLTENAIQPLEKFQSVEAAIKYCVKIDVKMQNDAWEAHGERLWQA